MRIVMQRRKSQVFLVDYLSTGAYFSIEILMEDIVFVAQEKKFENRLNPIKKFFGTFGI